MSMDESHPGRGLGFTIRNLFRSSSLSFPSTRPRRSLLRRGRSVIDSKNSIDPAKRASAPPMNDNQIREPAAMIGPAESSTVGCDIFEWYPRYQNCQRYFLDDAQHSVPVQALSAFLNIRLPFQWESNPVASSSSSSSSSTNHSYTSTPSDSSGPSTVPPSVSLIPYIRRLVATGMDFPGVLQGFFGNEWATGIGPLHEQERRNYLFAAKSGGWAAVKKDYDIAPLETIPFLRPLQGPLDSEIEAAERSWSDWLAMEDWMVGPRAPDALRDSSSNISRAQSSRG
ncbi:uncharacterized protein BO95DRAFT_441714 [Aspergillus brunneoviolaceus CBS 621.78]|uniref:Uncharacterized protein n=1 Tax=Aspergillus brunneoviolaceus CBS 621.78 TaxID=1450534 RepID=A0ACD1GBY4_9EURO|nr:hypothetical protein BO95DRAFT_441714 [Aspergillus brunneoviolaceus CBS 621.78]RAH46800.1 hypothetical protein BO95DRAFT_441714 [Aspergillus brunneoviolaceus CBS 621.78]